MKKAVKLIIVAAAACAALGMTAFASDTGIGTGTVNSTSGLRLRSEASVSAQVLTIMPHGSKVEVFEEGSGWFKVSYGGQAGYCSGEYIDFPQASNPLSGLVTASVLNVRSSPSTTAEVVDKLCSGTQVCVIGEADGWYHIQTAGGATGYVYSKYIVLSSVLSAVSEEASSLVQYALGFLGCSYRYGGNGPTSFDCSGFTKYIYSNYDYCLSRTAGGQTSDGTAVSKENLQPGDLVFFSESGNGYITHVGIYIGNYQIVHANTPSTGVIISDLSESYYTKYYAGACRVLG